MGWNDHIDWELQERIRGADELGFFDDQPLALAMAQRVADGLSMSEAQMHVFNSIALPILARPQNDGEKQRAALELDWEEGRNAHEKGE